MERQPPTMTDRIRTVARFHSPKFTQFVTRHDIEQELWVYALGRGKKHLDKHIAAGDEFRANRALHGVARQYCETEKAEASGYSFDDVAWYSPAKLWDLLPLALNAGWDGQTGEGDGTGRGSVDGREGGTLLAMVADVRRVLPPGAVLDAYDPTTDEGMQRLELLADRLGGEFPDAPGYRRQRRVVLSNSKATALTRSGWDD